MCALSIFLRSQTRESMRLNIDRDLVTQLTGLRTTSQWITSPWWVDTWARDMVMWYWSVAILFWQLPIDHIVNVQCKRRGFTKIRLRHPSLPFDSLPYPTRTGVQASGGIIDRLLRQCCFVWSEIVGPHSRNFNVRTLGQSRDNQTKRGWPYSMSMGREARVGAPLIAWFWNCYT